jgi:hypothetical protein
MNCTTGTTAVADKTIRKRRVQKSNGTSGCSYITNVNLYLHPSSHISTGIPIESEVPKIKTKCNNPGCFYYDCDLFSDDTYYCCNPLCSCFSPDWYTYL